MSGALRLTLPRARTFLPSPYVGMNGTEKRRAIELEAKRQTGLIAAWWYERMTLKLADDTRYTPDFFVLETDGTITLEEVKGFMRDDAAVKIKVAASLFPFRFVLYEVRSKKLGGGWTVTDYTHGNPPTTTPLPTPNT